MNPEVDLQPESKKSTSSEQAVKAVKAEKTPKTETKGADVSVDPSATATDVLYVGIDLGTSRSAVAASNGVRDLVASVVGYPKDNISTKLHGTRTKFGEDVLKHRLALDVVWPLADGNLTFTDLQGDDRARSRRAAEELIAQLRVMASPVADQKVYAVIGAPAEATKANKQAIIDIARDAGFDSIMVVSEPFAVAYTVDALESAIVIDIGAGTIDLCRMSGTLPSAEDQITVFKAGNFVDEEIAKRLRASHPEAQFTINMIKKAKEKFSSVTDHAQRAIVNFPVNGVPTDIDISSEVRESVNLIVPGIVEGIRSLVSSFDPEFQAMIRDRVFVGGGGSQIYGLREAIAEGMEAIGGGNVMLVDEPVFAGANGALKLAREMPVQYWEKLRNS
ncbi:MAG: rod shape-determining protein [Planctomycetota bacterium]